MLRMQWTLVCIVVLLATALPAQTATSTVSKTDRADDAELKFVVYFSRHGVRSPTGRSTQYDKFSNAKWPVWDVAPGILTPRGYHLMELFGAHDRAQLARQGLLQPYGCADADKVTFYADSDQRTRETGKALAAGLFPGCNPSVTSLTEGANDPLFHLSPSEITTARTKLATAAIAGRIGKDPNNLTEAYRAQLESFDHILATCGETTPDRGKRTSLLEIPAILSEGQGDHLAEMRGPLNTASTLAENLLLEYAEGMDSKSVGWGCVDEAAIKSLISLHTAATDFTQRTPTIAAVQASQLLQAIQTALEQAVAQHAVAGALSKKTDRALFLVGHDTNILNMAGTLGLTWIADGRRDDTPPGSTLIFELWKDKRTNSYEVRIYFSSQSLDQMRFLKELTVEAPPERVPVFIPGCSRADLSCSWSGFSQAIRTSLSEDRQKVLPSDAKQN